MNTRAYWRGGVPWYRYKTWRYSLGVALVVVIYAVWPMWTARVVNIIPRPLAAERLPNPEPALAVDPTNANRMAASAMSLGRESVECGALEGGVVTSSDKGKTWTLRCALPLRGDGADEYPDYAGDPSFDVVGSGSKAYGAYLTPAWETYARVVKSELAGPFPLPPTTILDLKDTDQPHIAANHGAGAQDYAISASVGESTSGCTDDGRRDAVVYAGQDVNPTSTCMQERSAAAEIPAVRSAWHADGIVYTVFYLPIDWSNRLTDVVVSKAMRNASGGVTYGAVTDAPATAGDKCNSRDGKRGFRLARCVTFPYSNANDPQFGQERRTLSHLSIAVHPKDANVVYVAWADSAPGGPSRLTLHVQASFDGGMTWDSADRFSARNATNPALAINEDGQVAFAYQQLDVRGGEAWWDTVVLLTTGDFTIRKTFILAETRAKVPVGTRVPYLGDYIDLVSVGQEFFGVFSANNDFAASVFPNGLTYVRKAPGTPVMLGYGLMVEISIDPYFFALERGSRFSAFVDLVSKWWP